MNPFAKQLAEFKIALQELESAVQQPLDERFTVQMILSHFPSAFAMLRRILADALIQQGDRPVDDADVFSLAFHRGWLTGDLPLWLRLASDAGSAHDAALNSNSSVAIAQDVRPCSYMLWETYELLSARFRYQTQVRPIVRPAFRLDPGMPAQQKSAYQAN